MAGGRLYAPANLSAGPRAGQEAQPVHRSHGSGAPITPSGQARRQRSAPPPHGGTQTTQVDHSSQLEAEFPKFDIADSACLIESIVRRRRICRSANLVCC